MSRIVFSAVGCRALLVSTVIALVIGDADPGSAQKPDMLRVTHRVETTGSTYTELSGRVFNDGPVDAVDVYVNAAAIDGAGKVLAQGIPYVGSVPAGGSIPFKARVPVVPGVTGYRVGINSFRFGLGRSESP
jgi:hypothetical protein